MGESQCPVGESHSPVGESQCPMGESHSPVGESQCPVGESQCPVGESHCPVGDSQCPVGESLCKVDLSIRVGLEIDQSVLNGQVIASATWITILLFHGNTLGVP